MTYLIVYNKLENGKLGNLMPKKKLQQKTRVKSKFRLHYRNLIILSTIFSLFTIAVFYFQLLVPKISRATVSGEYRSANSGNWNITSTWETYNGSAWVAASSTPTSSDNVITILNGHTVTITSNLNVDQVVVNSGGQITINSGVVLTIANGAGTDLDISGTLSNAGTFTLSSGATFSAQSGANYIHNQNTGNIPIATWNTGSTCSITGVTVTLPANINQSFYNLTYNCPNQTSVENTQANLTTVNGNFTVISTGTGALRFGPSNLFTFSVGGNFTINGGSLFLCGSNSPVFNIAGDFNMTGGSCVFTDANNSSGNGTPTMNVSGNFNVSGGTIEMSQFASNTSGKGIGTLNLYGNYIQTGGTITETANTLANSGFGKIYFAKSGTQIFYRNTGTITNTINFTVNSGSILDMGVSFPTGDGTFTVVSGGALIMASPNGITQTSASGNVQVTGTRSYSTSANYTYNATSAQVTGDGLPASVNNLSCDNASNVTLTNTVAVNGILVLLNGKIITNSNEISVTNSATSGITGHSSSNYVIGNLRRYINSSGSYDFPLGTLSYYELINLNLSNSTGPSNILGTFTNTNPIENSYPLSGVAVNGTTINDILNFGYWSLTPNTVLTSGTYSVTLNEKGYTNPVESAAGYCVLKRSGLGNNWQSLGTHNSATQSQTNSLVSATRSGLTSFSHFSIGSSGGIGGLPIKLISFDAKIVENRVDLNWSTASEVNNDYFTIERSINGIDFHSIYTTKGAGNSSIKINYSASDDSFPQEDCYYRLKQTDYDGKFTYSTIRFVKRNKTQAQESNLTITTVAPNPFVNGFSLNYSSAFATEGVFLLINTSGVTVFNERLNIFKGFNKYEFTDNINLPSGSYFATISVNGKNISKRIYKE
jgi:hypothetical protein